MFAVSTRRLARFRDETRARDAACAVPAIPSPGNNDQDTTMKLNTYLSFDGDCRDAFAFYASVFDGRITAMMTFGEAPGCDEMPADAKDRIMHARVEFGDQALMGTDATSMYPYRGVVGAHVVADVATPAQAETVFAALADGGRIEMPIGETFWAQRYGMVTDRFGVPWMVNCSHPVAA